MKKYVSNIVIVFPVPLYIPSTSLVAENLLYLNVLLCSLYLL